ncbi:MAG: hypothetical protein ACI8WY_002837 [Planctomycetota bacterium]|jgi:hypothetical protein
MGKSLEDPMSMDKTLPPGPQDGSTRSVSPLWVLGTLILLAFLGGGVNFLVQPRGAVLDPVETASKMFESVAQPVPFGLAPTEARRLPSREIVLTYERARSAGDAAAKSLGIEPGSEPESLTLMEFPAARAESVLEEQFQKLRFDSPGGGGGRGGRGGRGGSGGRRGRSGGPPGGDKGGGKDGEPKKPKLQDAGFFEWQGFSANFARLRHTPAAEEASDGGDSAKEQPSAEGSESERDPKGRSGGKPAKTYDTVRVNLSTGGRCIIAYVRFPLGAEGTIEAAGALLGAFMPHMPTDPATGTSQTTPR